jgi:hypothetical protein
VVRGDAPWLLAWLIGRHGGERLNVTGATALPALEPWG